jgi:hypothetical protein
MSDMRTILDTLSNMKGVTTFEVFSDEYGHYAVKENGDLVPTVFYLHEVDGGPELRSLLVIEGIEEYQKAVVTHLATKGITNVKIV